MFGQLAETTQQVFEHIKEVTCIRLAGIKEVTASQANRQLSNSWGGMMCQHPFSPTLGAHVSTSSASAPSFHTRQLFHHTTCQQACIHTTAHAMHAPPFSHATLTLLLAINSHEKECIEAENFGDILVGKRRKERLIFRERDSLSKKKEEKRRGKERKEKEKKGKEERKKEKKEVCLFFIFILVFSFWY